MVKHYLGLAAIAFCAILTGCALSKTTIDERTPELKYTTKGTLALTVVDNRPFVVSGEKAETVEGIFRGAYGIPFKFEGTRSDPDTLYTARISEIVSKALYNTGSKVNVVQTKKGATVQDAINGLRAAPFDAGLVINVIDSRIDAGGIRWSYFFDYEVVVLDSQGAIVSTKKYSGEDVDFQRELFHTGSEKGKSYAFDAVLDLEYRNKFSEFLNDRETQAALGTTHAAEGRVVAAKQEDGDGARRLAALKDLLDKGLITTEDYEKKKGEILQSL